MIELRSQDYNELEYTPGSAIDAGELVLAATLGGSLNAFVFADIAANVPGVAIFKAKKAAATKVPGDSLAFAPGEKVYYNTTSKKVTKTASDVLIGFCIRAAIAADTEVLLAFDGEAQEDRADTIKLSQISDLEDLTIDVDQLNDPENLSITMSQISDLEDLTFAELDDVDVTGVDDNDTLKYVQSTGKWTKVAAS